MSEGEFSEGELEASLRRAFVEKKADYLIVDGNYLRSAFLRQVLRLGIDKGWVYHAENLDEDDVLGNGLGQSLVFIYRLTSKGQKYFFRS